MELNKTLNELITEIGENNVYGTGIVDDATKSALTDYFYWRYICDNDKFVKFFQRDLKQYKNQYLDYLRTENIEFDPMVTRYLERQVLNKVNTTGNERITGSETGNKYTNNGGTITRKTDITGTGTASSNLTGNGSYTDATGRNYSESNAGSENHQDRTRDILSVFPQANVSSATSGRLDDPVSYAYATQMNDKLNKGDSSNSGNKSGNETGSANGTSSSTQNQTANNRNVTDGREVTTNATNQNIQNNVSNTKTGTSSSEEDSNLKERFTGRENYDAGTLLSHARDYIVNTNAFMWYVSKLEKCFIGNLRYGEE